MKKWNTGSRVIHLLRVINPNPPYEFSFSSLEDPAIKIVAPGLVTEKATSETESSTTEGSQNEYFRWSESHIKASFERLWKQ